MNIAVQTEPGVRLETHPPIGCAWPPTANSCATATPGSCQRRHLRHVRAGRRWVSVPAAPRRSPTTSAGWRSLASTRFGVYTPPRRDLLDEAARHGLRVMVGLPWSQHIAFLDDRALRREIRARS